MDVSGALADIPAEQPIVSASLTFPGVRCSGVRTNLTCGIFEVPGSDHGRAAIMKEGGSLRDIAPTMLFLLDLPQPSEMTGQALLEFKGDRA